MSEPTFIGMTMDGFYLTEEQYGVRIVTRVLRRLLDNTDDLIEACPPPGRDFKWYIEIQGNLDAMRALNKMRDDFRAPFPDRTQKDWRISSIRFFPLGLGRGPQILCDRDHFYHAKFAVLISYDDGFGFGRSIDRRHFFCGTHARYFAEYHGLNLKAQ